MNTWQQTRSWLLDTRQSGIRVAAHRGKFSSSVLENTSRAFLLAIGQGADMVEMDLALTKDNVLIGHHDKTMQRLLHVDQPVSDFTWAEIQAMPVYNYFNDINVVGLETFDHILHALKDRSMITLDRCWDYLDPTYEALCRAGMVEQAIIKFHIANEAACQWAEAHPDCIFIPMVRHAELLPRVEELAKHTCVAGVEILPQSEDHEMISPDTIAWLKARNLRIWCNSLSLAKRLVFGAGHDDLLSMDQGGDAGWGYLADHGVDIIQTDWPFEVTRYLEQTGRR